MGQRALSIQAGRIDHSDVSAVKVNRRAGAALYDSQSGQMPVYPRSPVSEAGLQTDTDR